jgi:uncharacterized protein YutD
MKLNRNLLCIIAGCLVLLLLVCGCQHKEESEEIYQEPNTTQEDIVDLEALEYEYTSMINLMDKVLTVLSEEDLTMNDVTSLIKYVSDNRIEPTQKLTIELDQYIDEFIKVGINYYTTRDENKKLELEGQLVEIFQHVEEKMLEIEMTINGVEEL